MDEIGAAFWDERYASRDAVWSGEPNGTLHANVNIQPGAAARQEALFTILNPPQ